MIYEHQLYNDTGPVLSDNNEYSYYVSYCWFGNQNNRAIFLNSSLPLNCNIFASTFLKCRYEFGNGGAIYYISNGKFKISHSCGIQCANNGTGLINGGFIKAEGRNYKNQTFLLYSTSFQSDIKSSSLSTVFLVNGKSEVMGANSTNNKNIAAASGFATGNVHGSSNSSFCNVVNNTSDKNDVLSFWYMAGYKFHHCNVVENNITHPNGILCAYGCDLFVEDSCFLHNFILQVFYADVGDRNGSISLTRCSTDQLPSVMPSVYTSNIGNKTFSLTFRHEKFELCEIIHIPPQSYDNYHDDVIDLPFIAFEVFMMNVFD